MVRCFYLQKITCPKLRNKIFKCGQFFSSGKYKTDYESFVLGEKYKMNFKIVTEYIPVKDL